MTLELKNGSIIVPRNIFDVFDVVEEHMGTDVRECLEAWFECDQADEVSMPEHFAEVLETIDCELGKIPRQKKKEQEQTLERVQNLIRRELNGKENV